MRYSLASLHAPRKKPLKSIAYVKMQPSFHPSFKQYSMQAIGKPFTLWCAFARFYERHNSLDNARIIFDKATAVAFKYVDDLASVWCEYAEMELRHQNYKNALNLLRQATAVPPSFDRRQV